MAPSNIKLAIIEDDIEVLTDLESYFRSQPEFSLVFGARSVENFFKRERGAEFDIVLTDIGLPGMSGIEGIKLIKQKMAETDVVMITVFKDSDKVFQSLCAGASGYILKGDSLQEIKNSILTIVEGGSYMSPAIARKVVEYFNPRHKKIKSLLTPKEDQIVKYLVDGLSYKLIADRLLISIDTVRFHIRNIYSKLQVNSKSEVILKSLRGEI